MQEGIGPEICFQSARIRVERAVRRQTEGEIRPVMMPERVRMGSSDSPRRERSATRPVVGSQPTAYHLQQSLPVQEEKTPRNGSLRASRIARRASRSEGLHVAAPAPAKRGRRRRSEKSKHEAMVRESSLKSGS